MLYTNGLANLIAYLYERLQPHYTNALVIILITFVQCSRSLNGGTRREHLDLNQRCATLAPTTPKAMLIGPVGFGGSLAQVASPAKQVSQNINAAWII